ncbi:hypothetical protein [Microbulbifer sp. PSTR4-B]|uniref:hypothetical protein n=1 Tax=unclassified Microbulbifer TaxID=2619833 RepID=UPI00403AF427
MSKFSLLVSLGGALTPGFSKSFKKGNALQRRFGQEVRRNDKALAAAKGLKKHRDALARLEARYQASSVKGERARQVVERKRKELWKAAKAAQQYGVNINNVERKLERLQKRSKGLSTLGRLPGAAKGAGAVVRRLTLAASIATGGMFGLVKSTADASDQAIKTADKLGFSVEGLQRYRYAAERSGLSVEKFDMSAQRMVRRIAEAAAGTGEAVKAIDELGLDAQWLAQLAPEEQIKVIADAMAGVGSQGDRVRLAMKFFDSEGVGMVNMLRGGRKELESLHQQANATGNVLSREQLQRSEKFVDSWTNMTTTFKGFKNTLATELMPAFTKMLDRFTEWMQDPEAKEQALDFARGMIETGKGLGSLAVHLGRFGLALPGLIGGFKVFGVVVGAIMTVALMPFISLLSIPGAIVVGIATAVGLLWANWDKVTGAVRRFGGWLQKVRDNTLGKFWDKLPEGARSALIKIKDLAFTLLRNSPLGLLFRGASWVGRKLFGGGEETPAAVRHSLAPAAARGGDSSPAAEPASLAQVRPRGGGSVTLQSHLSAPISVYPAPDMDEGEIVQKVGEELDRRQREQQEQQRAMLFDASALGGG